MDNLGALFDWSALVGRLQQDSRAVGHGNGQTCFRIARIESLESRHLLSAAPVGDAADASALAAVAADSAVASNLLVTTANDVVDSNDGLTSLREAINYANTHAGDDTITFATDLAGKTITLIEGELDITDTTGVTTISGLGKDELTLDANYASRLFRIADGAIAVISDMTIAHGAALDGGAIENQGTLNVARCFFDHSFAENGAGIENSGVLTLVDSVFSRCFSSSPWTNENIGGGLDNRGTATVDGCSFEFCSSNVGGGIANFGTLTIGNSSFFTNSANQGGGIYNGGVLTVAGSVFQKNCKAGDNGGGGAIENCGTATISDTTFTANYSWSTGGGIENLGTLTISDSSFSRNGAKVTGGGINDRGVLTQENLTFSENYCGYMFSEDATLASGADIADSHSAPSTAPAAVDTVASQAGDADDLAVMASAVSSFLASAQATHGQFSLNCTIADTTEADRDDTSRAVAGGGDQSIPARSAVEDHANFATLSDGDSNADAASVDGLFASFAADAFWPAVAEDWMASA